MPLHFVRLPHGYESKDGAVRTHCPQSVKSPQSENSVCRWRCTSRPAVRSWPHIAAHNSIQRESNLVRTGWGALIGASSFQYVRLCLYILDTGIALAEPLPSIGRLYYEPQAAEDSHRGLVQHSDFQRTMGLSRVRPKRSGSSGAGYAPPICTDIFPSTFLIGPSNSSIESSRPLGPPASPCHRIVRSCPSPANVNPITVNGSPPGPPDLRCSRG